MALSHRYVEKLHEGEGYMVNTLRVMHLQGVKHLATCYTQRPFFFTCFSSSPFLVSFPLPFIGISGLDLWVILCQWISSFSLFWFCGKAWLCLTYVKTTPWEQQAWPALMASGCICTGWPYMAVYGAEWRWLRRSTSLKSKFWVAKQPAVIPEGSEPSRKD